MKKVLIPVTNCNTLGDQENGTYAPELTHVVAVLEAAGVAYDIASIKGGAAPLYGTDIEGDTVNAQVLANEAFQAKVKNTLAVTAVDVSQYDAIFYPGGFGLLYDLAENADVAALAAKLYEAGGVIAAVCHGPGALLPITLSNGERLLSTKSVTGFTREEEVDYGTIEVIPFLLEESLTRASGQYSKKQPWSDYIVTDGRLITGQNPASAHSVGVALLELLAV